MKIQPKPKKWEAYAKINLTLEVVGKREDGYHEIASIVQAIDLCDTLYLQPGEHIRIASNIPGLVTPNNLVFKAVRLMQDYTGSNRGVDISLEKGIPLASGLGGGSSDAAIALRALNEIWESNLSSENLQDVAANLGSDIFFFLKGGRTSLVAGRGDKVTALPPLPKTWVVLIKPPVNMVNKTQRMYAGLAPSNYTHSQATQRMLETLYRRGRDVYSFCYNVFEDIAFDFFPGLEEYRRRFLAAGAGEVHLAGSGPTLFTIVEEKAQGEEIYRRLNKERIEVYLAQTL
jgi:4-diphosphocytidyl-2-C-methyl-D-erythritol kinase